MGMGQASKHIEPHLGIRETAGLPARAGGEEVAAGGWGSLACGFETASPREVPMGASRSIACVVVSVFVAVSAWAAEGNDQMVVDNRSPVVASAEGGVSVEHAAHRSSAAGGAPLRPWVHQRMNDALRDRVEVAFEIAAQRVQGAEACAQLFVELEADASETLGSALYWPVLSYRDVKELCGRRNLAFTRVGSRLTFICPDFERISDLRAAQVIIHEALHNAGLKEKPQYAGAGVKSAAAIDSMVAKACGF
jgi:hypothetical protein